MKYSLLLSSAFVVAVGGFWIACVGDDPAASGGPATGDYKGACFGDKTCKTGLVCTQDVCLNPGEQPLADGGTQLTDASGTDDGRPSEGGTETTDAAPDSGGGSACGPISTQEGFEVSCPGAPSDFCTNDATRQCCREASNASCRQMTDCVTGGGTPYTCDDSKSCNGTACCVPAMLLDARTSCGQRIEPTGGSHCAGNTCGNSEVQLCNRDGSDCIFPKRCVPVNVVLEGAAKAIWKICL